MPLKGLSMMWPDRSRSEIYDLSLAGILVSAQAQVALRKVGQQCEIRLDLDDKGHSIFLKARIETLNGETIGLVFEALSAAHRLVIEQNVKDRILIQNLRVMPEAYSAFPQATWFHGPFDTNLFLWQSSPENLEKAVVEYDNLIWSFDQNGSVQIFKSGAATNSAKAYLHLPDLGTSAVRISLGASWLDRLSKCLEVLIQGQYLPQTHADSLRILQSTLKECSR